MTVRHLPLAHRDGANAQPQQPMDRGRANLAKSLTQQRPACL
jgi:hypothetical protein